MTDDRAMKRYRQLYSKLLRLYPETFRNRFAESMEQTFQDMCRERRAAERGLLAFAFRLFAETFTGILRERSVLIMSLPNSIIRIALITASILAVPLVGMQLSDEVNWTLFDFVAAGVLLFGAGLTFELVTRRSGNITYRVATGLACATALLLIWINLAVGLIGAEDNPANVLYLGVLLVGGVGAARARLRPQGMSRALFATAIAQAVVPVLAIVIWKPLVAGEEKFAGLTGVLVLNAFFVLLFLASAFLFRRAGGTEPKSS